MSLQCCVVLLPWHDGFKINYQNKLVTGENGSPATNDSWPAVWLTGHFIGNRLVVPKKVFGESVLFGRRKALVPFCRHWLWLFELLLPFNRVLLVWTLPANINSHTTLCFCDHSLCQRWLWCCKPTGWPAVLQTLHHTNNSIHHL